MPGPLRGIPQAELGGRAPGWWKVERRAVDVVTGWQAVELDGK